MRVLIVDDERIARKQLKLHLGRYEDVELIGEAESGLQAVALINKMAPDVVFLDVEMPDISGFEILPYLKASPRIVFASSHDRYAIKAFETQALDYILKPVEPERLQLTLDRLRQNLPSTAPADLNHERGLEKLIIRETGTYQVLWVRDIAMFRKEGRYTSILLENQETHLIELTLDYLEKRIPEAEFYRINRQTMLRREHVKALRAGPAGSGLVDTRAEESHPVSRGRWKSFKDWFLEEV